MAKQVKKSVNSKAKKVVRPRVSKKDSKEAEKIKRLENFNYIIEAIERGEAVRNAVKGLMSSRTFFEMIDADKELEKRYARACDTRADSIFEDILSIADEDNADISIVDGKMFIDGSAVQRSRLKIDARKWMLGKMNPKKYGEKTEIDLKSSDGTMSPTPIIFTGKS